MMMVDTSAALERSIAERMQAGHVPGLALAIVRDLEVVYSRGLGVTSVEDGGQPVTGQTLFRIGSLTKSMTAMAVMHLVEAGRLDLDRPVTTYVPWLAFEQEGIADRVTLRMLLSHSAGLPTSHTPYGRREASGLEAYVRDDVPAYHLIAPPGKLYSYSNPGLRIAGYIAQAVSGQPYTQLMQKLVFDPLAMRRTTFDPTVAMTYPLAQSHEMDDDGTLYVQHRYADDTAGYPSGGAISTAADLCNLAITYMDGGRFGGRQVLARELVVEMQRLQVDGYTTSGAGYGLGLAVDCYKGLRRVTHNGSISAFGSRLVMVPEAGTAVVLLFNRAAGFWTTAEAIVDDVLDELLGLPATAAIPAATEPDCSLWSLYSGAYLGDWRGLAVVDVVDGQLRLTWNGAELPLKPLRRDLYFGQRPGSGETVSVGFVPEAGGPVQYLQVNSSPCRRVQMEIAWLSTPGTWQAYAGKYTGVETFTLRLAGDRLLAYSADEGREVPCVPVGDARFACDVGLIDFSQDSSGQSFRLGNTYTLRRK
jgi:CubicO group peptidase (beta-lactamase class C family)